MAVAVPVVGGLLLLGGSARVVITISPRLCCLGLRAFCLRHHAAVDEHINKIGAHNSDGAAEQRSADESHYAVEANGTQPAAAAAGVRMTVVVTTMAVAVIIAPAVAVAVVTTNEARELVSEHVSNEGARSEGDEQTQRAPIERAHQNNNNRQEARREGGARGLGGDGEERPRGLWRSIC